MSESDVKSLRGYSMTLAAGTRLGPYEILSPLGAGGMGEVYRRFAVSGIWLRHRRAARGHALDRTGPRRSLRDRRPDVFKPELGTRSRGASRFARLLRETWSRRERT